MEARTYTVNIEPAEEGGFWAYVPALPGCFTQAESLEKVIDMIKEAAQGFVEVLAEKGKPIPVEKHHPQHLTLNLEVNVPARA